MPAARPDSLLAPAAAGLALGAAAFGVEGVLGARPFLAELPPVPGTPLFLTATAAAWLAVGASLASLAALVLPPVRGRAHHAPIPAAGILATLAGLSGHLHFHQGMVLTAAAAFAVGAGRVLRGRPASLAGVSVASCLAVTIFLGFGTPRRNETIGAPRAPAARAPLPGAPDVLIVVLDTVRADHTSLLGYPRDTTPTLTRLANEGANFTRAFASGCWSVPTHASLFTGLSPSRHGATWEAPRLAATVPTLAQVLGDAGYRTALFTGNPWLSPDNGLARGFGTVAPSIPVHPVSGAFLLRSIEQAVRRRDKGGSASVAAFRAFLRERDPRQPYLAVVNLFEPHGPYDAVPVACGERFLAPGADRRRARRAAREAEVAEFEGGTLAPADVVLARDLYDGAVRCGDELLAGLLAALAERGDPHRTLVLALSDHGEEFGEHGAFGHAYGLWRDLVQVPLVARYPARIAPGTQVEALVRVVDLMPTVLAWAGLPAAAWPEMEGQPLQPVLDGTETSPRRALAEQSVPTWVRQARRARHPGGSWPEMEVRRRALVHGETRYEQRSDGSESLYDWSDDPDERNDLAPGGHPALETSRALLSAATAGPGTDFAAPVPDVPAETGLGGATEERLRALGYLR